MPQTSDSTLSDDLQSSFGDDWRRRASEVREAAKPGSDPLLKVVNEVGKRVKAQGYRIQRLNLALYNDSGKNPLLERLTHGDNQDVLESLRKKATEDWKFSQCVAVADTEDHYLASGVLIAPDVVLTAGHSCANGYKSHVWVGNKVGNGAGQVYTVRKAVVHPDFIGAPYFRNDLAILYLEKEVPEPTILPIATKQELNRADWVVAVGYGTISTSSLVKTGVRRFVHVPKLKGKLVDKWGKPIRYDQGTEFVAGTSLLQPTYSKDACAGDSGGPVFLKRGKKDWCLAGITSRNAGRDHRPCGGGSIYVRLDAYRSWLDEVSSGSTDHGEAEIH